MSTKELRKNGFHINSIREFQVCYFERYVVEYHIFSDRIIRHFFFQSLKQIQIAWQFYKGFILETNTIFNQKDIWISFSAKIDITNIMSTFSVVNWFISP